MFINTLFSVVIYGYVFFFSIIIPINLYEYVLFMIKDYYLFEELEVLEAGIKQAEVSITPIVEASIIEYKINAIAYAKEVKCIKSSVSYLDSQVE